MRLLVVEDDPVFRSVIQKALRGQAGLNVTEAHGVREATALLKQGKIDLLLTDLRLDDGDGLDLIAALPELAPEAIPVLMSSVATSRDHQSALRLGAVDVLTKPFTREELLGALQRAIDSTSGFRGSIHGLSLTDLLQMFHLASRSLVLEIRGARHQGALYFQDGEIVHAQAGPRQGAAALRALLTMQAGAIHTMPARPCERTIEGAFQVVLMDAFREMDEEGKDRHKPITLSPASASPVSGVGQALQSFVGQLDAELGAALLTPGGVEVVLPGRLTPSQWALLGGVSRRVEARWRPGWRQLQWEVKGLGLTLLRASGDICVVLAQVFVDNLDDRRFRWNAARVERFLRDDRGAARGLL